LKIDEDGLEGGGEEMMYPKKKKEQPFPFKVGTLEKKGAKFPLRQFQ